MLQAIQAEGIPICGGYAVPLYRQPLFRNKAFGPYLPRAAAKLDYGAVCCPNCERICAEQGAWLEQSLLLGSQSDMDDIARAVKKVYENRGALTQP
jgi:dTDP-4-amino-4,6-dideoxygalactose transaminase